MTARLLDMVWAVTTTQGTGTLTLGDGVVKEFSRWLSFAEGGAVDGEEYAYFIQDGSAGWERGSGTYSASAGTLTRGTTISLSRTDGSTSTSPLDLSGRATVACVLRAADHASIASVQDALTTASTGATASAASAAAAATSASAAATSAAAADPTSRLLRAGDTMTGALNWKAAVNVASATTCDIGAATSNLVNITGTTTITGLGTITSGAMRWVKFAGILTLTYNASSLILPTAATITTAANDTAVFISEGSGNWRCLSYTRASGLALVPTPNTPNAVQVDSQTVSSPVAAIDIAIATGYYKLTLFLKGISHNNGSNRAIGIAFGTAGTGGSFSAPIDLTAAIVAAASVNITVEFLIDTTVAQPITYATAGTAGFETAIPAATNAIRIGCTNAGAFSTNLDAGTAVLFGIKLG